MMSSTSTNLHLPFEHPTIIDDDNVTMMSTATAAGTTATTTAAATATNNNDEQQYNYSLQDLPEEMLRHVALFLAAPDILQMLCVHRQIYKSCGGSPAFWNSLLLSNQESQDEFEFEKNNSNTTTTTTTTTTWSNSNNCNSKLPACGGGGAGTTMAMRPTSGSLQKDDDDDDVATGKQKVAAAAAMAKQKFLLRSYTALLPRVKWIPIANNNRRSANYNNIPDAREGHLACQLGTKEHPIYVFNGGFTDDTSVYCMYKPRHATTTTSSPLSANHIPATAGGGATTENSTLPPTVAATWLRLQPTMSPSEAPIAAAAAAAVPQAVEQQQQQVPAYVYGASLTRLDERRAIRFGGFQSGGYTGETNQVAVLTVDIPEQQHQSPQAATTATAPSAHWQVIPIKGGVVAHPRAYHTAILLQQRYLLVVGGMTSRGCILQESILDTHTWQWLNVNVSVSTFGATLPSPRHGHSMVLDPRRNRLVLFGGGSGSDLLRSGTDNTEVWELKMDTFGSWQSDVIASLPWKWNQLYADGVPQTDNQDQNNPTNQNEQQQNVAAAATPPSTIPKCPLSLGEGLVLGRCHVALRVSVDTVLFAFGSGRPSTNSVMAYDLRTDTFVRPRMEGPFPRPRFTAAAIFIENDGYLLVHGGFSTQQRDTTHEVAVLDLAPAIQRSFDWLPVRAGGTTDNMLGHPPVACDDVLRDREAGAGATIGQMLMDLSGASPAMRQRLAMGYLGALMSAGGGDGGGDGGDGEPNVDMLRLMLSARMGQPLMGEDDDDEDDDDDMESGHDNDDDDDDMDDDDDEVDDEDDDVDDMSGN